MIETTIANWGNVNPVQFVRAVTHQHANDLAETGRKLRLMEDSMLQRSGGESGRDFTAAESAAWNQLQRATREVSATLIAVNKALGENVVLPVHDGGPDRRDGADSDGVLV